MLLDVLFIHISINDNMAYVCIFMERLMGKLGIF